MKFAAIFIFMLLAACGNQASSNAMTNGAAPDGPMPPGTPPLASGPKVECTMPKLDLRAAKLDDRRAAAFTDNFKIAFDKACTEGLLAKEPLVDARSADPSTLLVMDAPEANVVSLYFNVESTPPMTFLEAPFGRGPDVPSADDIHEAFYCKLHGATEEEIEKSGRCLPD